MEEDKFQLVLHNDDLEKLVLYDPNSKSLLVRNSTENLKQKSKELVLQQQIDSPYSPIPNIRSSLISSNLLPSITGINNSNTNNNNINNNNIHNHNNVIGNTSSCCPYCKRSYILNNSNTNNTNINNNENINNNNTTNNNTNTSNIITPFNASPYYRSPISEPQFISRDYFLLLQDASSKQNNNNNNPTSPISPNLDQQSTSGLSSELLNIGYYKKFFKEDVKIGSGGFGSVYLCRHLINGIDLGEFAIKKVPVGENLPWLFRVLKEVKALETLTKHRNIINYKHSWLEYDQIADFGPKVPCLYILMEYANHGNLQDYMASKRDTIPESEIWSFFIDLCHGIGYLHHSGIIHRDIKPPNILIHQSYDSITDRQVTHLMISDFGTCDTISSANIFKDGGIGPIKRTGNTGTVEYLAPELLQRGIDGEYSGDYDEKCDIWSLGILLFQMAYGTLPYRNSGNPFVEEDPARNLPNLLEEISQFSNSRLVFPQVPQRSRDLKDMITILLRSKPHERPTISQIISTQFIQSKTKHYTIHPIHIIPPTKKPFKNTSSSNVSSSSTSTATAAKLRRKNSISNSNVGGNGGNSVTTTTTTTSSISNNIVVASKVSPIRTSKLVEENSDNEYDDNGNSNKSLIQPIVLSDSDQSDSENSLSSDESDNDNIIGNKGRGRRSPTNKLTRQRTISNSGSGNIGGNNNGVILRKSLPTLLEAPRIHHGRFKRAAIVIQKGVKSSTVYQAFYMLQALFQVWLCFDQCSIGLNSFPSPILLYPLLLLSLIPILVLNNSNMNMNGSNGNLNLNSQDNNRKYKKINTTISIIKFVYYLVISILLPREFSCKSTSSISNTASNVFLPPIADYVVFPLLSLFKNLTLLIINLIFIFYRD